MITRPLTALIALVLTAGCYQGKDDVPRMSSYATTSSGSGSSASSGGAGGSSATSSAASTGASSSSGMPVDPCANTIFCDDFEAYAAGSPPAGKWGNNQSTGSLAVNTGKAHSGKNAVKITGDATTDYRSATMFLADKSVLPVAGNHLFGRMMFFLESAPDTSVHWTFIAGSGPVTGQNYHAIYRYGGQQPIMKNGAFAGSQLMANYETPDSYQNPPVGPSSDCWLHSNMQAVPTGAWACAEWEFDGPNNTMRFWLNGTELKDLQMSGMGQGCVNQPATFAWTAPSFERIDLGWESYQMDDARTIWIDDVALGTKKLGCPQ